MLLFLMVFLVSLMAVSVFILFSSVHDVAQVYLELGTVEKEVIVKT